MDRTEYIRRYTVEASPDWSISYRDGNPYVVNLWGLGRCSLAEGQWIGTKTAERADLLGRHWVATGIAPMTACCLSDAELEEQAKMPAQVAA